MAIQVQIRRGTTAENSTFTGAVGELTVDTTKDTVVVHDGSTAGGFPLAKESQATTSAAITGGTINGTAIGATTASTGAFTNLAYTGTLTGGTGVVNLGSGQLFKDANGNVGIGTSNPSQKLDLAGTGNTTARIGADGSSETALHFGNTTIGRVSVRSAAPLAFETSAAERMRIDSSGNVGIGTQAAQGLLTVAGKVQVGVVGVSNNTAGLVLAPQILGQSVFSAAVIDSSFTIRTGNNAVQSNNTELMRIDSAGNVGIGTSSPENFGGFTTQTINGSSGGVLAFQNGGTANTARIVKTSSVFSIEAIAAIPIVFRTNNAESARIDSSGNLLVGTTISTVGNGGAGTKGFRVDGNNGIVQAAAISNIAAIFNRTSTDGEIVQFRKNGTIVGTISVTDSATAYNTSSDYRLKEDWQPMVGAVARLKQLKPVNFAWKADGSRVDGFLAHEAQEVVPEAVTGTKGAVDKDGKPEYQGIDQSKLVPLLTAALQDSIAEIESLKARLDAANL